MHYYKSRIDIRDAAKERLAEATAVLDAARQTLDPTLQAYDIPRPEDIVDRLLESDEKGDLKIDDDVVKLISTLTRYERAKAAKEQFELIVEHIATFSEAKIPYVDMDTEIPIEWRFIQLTEGDLSFYFCTYEGIAGSPNARYHPHNPARLAAAVLQEARGTHVGQLERLLHKDRAMGMSTALRR